MHNAKSFEQRIADLKAYKKKHGHINVKEKEDKSLNGFCLNIRYARNNPDKSNRVLSDDRIASLDALGFDWAVYNTKTFDQRIADKKLLKPAPKKGRKTIGKSRRHGTDNNKAIAAVATSFKMKMGDEVVFNGNRFTVLRAPRGNHVMAESKSGFKGNLEISKIKPYTG